MRTEDFTNERKRIFQLLNGDLFFPIKPWPKNIKKRFFNKPHSDKDTMILFLFFHGTKIFISWVRHIFNSCLKIMYLIINAWFFQAYFYFAVVKSRLVDIFCYSKVSFDYFRQWLFTLLGAPLAALLPS